MRNERRLRAVGVGVRDAARAFRQELTPAEQALWERLRDRRLQGLKFRRQHPLHGFVLDFYCPTANLVIEVDGAVHADPVQRQRDVERSQQLTARGLRVLRVSNQQALTDIEPTLRAIADACLAAPEPYDALADTHPA